MSDDVHAGLAVVPEGDVPSVDDHSDDEVQVWFNNQDSIVYTKSYVDQVYVDNNIVNFSIQPDVGTLDVDNQMLTLSYESGEEYQLILGSIQETGPSASKFYQVLSQLIVSADADLVPLFNYQTTPNLLRLRQGLNQLMGESLKQRIEIGYIVYDFAKMLKGLESRDMSDVLKEIKNQQ